MDARAYTCIFEYMRWMIIAAFALLTACAAAPVDPTRISLVNAAEATAPPSRELSCYDSRAFTDKIIALNQQVGWMGFDVAGNIVEIYVNAAGDWGAYVWLFEFSCLLASGSDWQMVVGRTI